MSLSLGLEALNVTFNVTDADLYSAEVTALESQMACERAVFDAVTTSRNLHNFNEIISSLKKHSSAECLEFAQDLVGHGISLEADTPAAADANAAAESKWSKVKATLKQWWNDFTGVVSRCTQWVKDRVNELLTKLKINHDGKVYVRFNAGQIESVSGIVTGLNGQTSENTCIEQYKKFNELFEKKQEKTELDLSEANAYLHKLTGLQSNLSKIMASSGLKSLLNSEENTKIILTLQKILPKVQKIVTGEIRMMMDSITKSAKSSVKDELAAQKKAAKEAKKNEEKK